ncbi:permease [Lignipirellula cremea]|nr:permease [Lignipirellula cremea]
MLVGIFGFPADFALRYMVPGTAIGVFLGDLLFFSMAVRTANRTRRQTITAMPLGLDTPSTIGMVLFVLGPAYTSSLAGGMTEVEAAQFTWQIGICSIVISGLFKLVCSFGANKIREVIPRAGLLGSLAAIALVLIAFLPLVESLSMPIVGLVALSIVLATLVARMQLPFQIPGALGALVIASSLYYLMAFLDLLPAGHAMHAAADWEFPTEWVTVFQFGWLAALEESFQYLPIVIPFALATVVGGIDCTESAAAAGDEFDTGEVIRVEAFATLVAGLCGGVIQTTPYIGHPAYKAMGGRSAYTLATALFVGAVGVLGLFNYIYLYLPQPTVFPILVFIGLEITAQSFLATPRRHYPAVAFACVPALGSLAAITAKKYAPLGPPEGLTQEFATLVQLQNGFIVTSLLWATLLAAMIDQRLKRAACFLAICGVCCLFGVIHSPLLSGAMFLPWPYEGNPLSPAQLETVLRYTIGYLASAGLLLAWGFVYRPDAERMMHDHDHTATHDDTPEKPDGPPASGS